jgi:hypothetical protein
MEIRVLYLCRITQVLRLDPGSPSLVRAHDHVIGYNPFLPTLIKSSGAKNCRVSIPVCEPYTKPLGTKCRPVWVGGSLKILLLTPTVNHTPWSTVQ